MKKEYYVIKDLEEFVKSLRILVYNNFANTGDIDTEHLYTINGTEEEFETCLSKQECMVIAKSKLKIQYNKTRTKTRYLTTEKRTQQIIDLFQQRMVSNLLSGLVNKGYLESAYDESINDFVFWEPLTENNKEEQ